MPEVPSYDRHPLGQHLGAYFEAREARRDIPRKLQELAELRTTILEKYAAATGRDRRRQRSEPLQYDGAWYRIRTRRGLSELEHVPPPEGGDDPQGLIETYWNVYREAEDLEMEDGKLEDRQQCALEMFVEARGGRLQAPFIFGEHRWRAFKDRTSRLTLRED